MEKETVGKFDLESAFKALDELDIPKVAQGSRVLANRVNLRERFAVKPAHEILVEDYFDVNNTDDLEAAKEEREAEIAKAKLARIEKIVDLDAETEDDILPSYVGKLIIQCPQCMTLFYKNEEDIETSEETPDVVNINEVCQHCGNASGYTLIGKVGGITEDEAANFDLDEIEAEDDNELNLDFPEEGTEEADSGDTEDLDFDFEDLEPEENEGEEGEEAENAEEDEGTEETNESLQNSNLLKKAEEDDDSLKSENESEHLTLNEEIEAQPEIEEQEKAEAEDQMPKVASTEESLHNSQAQQDAAKNSELETDFHSDNLTLNEDAVDGLLDKLWTGPQPTDEETLDNLKAFDEAFIPAEEVEELPADEIAQLEDLDEESFNEHLTKYMTEVYSNVESFAASSCSSDTKQLVVEGIIKFKSGREKATRFVFESLKEGLLGSNKDFAESKAFTLKAKITDKKLITEGLCYNYKIGSEQINGQIHN